MEARFSAPVQTSSRAHPASCTTSTRSFLWVKSGRGVTLTPHPLLVSRSRKSRAIPLLPLWGVRPVQGLSACTRVHFTFTVHRHWPKRDLETHQNVNNLAKNRTKSSLFKRHILFYYNDVRFHALRDVTGLYIHEQRSRNTNAQLQRASYQKLIYRIVLYPATAGKLNFCVPTCFGHVL